MTTALKPAALTADLAQLRKQRRLSACAFAKQIGIHRNSVRRIEDGANPDLNIALRIARFYGLPVEQLWGDVA